MGINKGRQREMGWRKQSTWSTCMKQSNLNNKYIVLERVWRHRCHDSTSMNCSKLSTHIETKLAHDCLYFWQPEYSRCSVRGWNNFCLSAKSKTRDTIPAILQVQLYGYKSRPPTRAPRSLYNEGLWRRAGLARGPVILLVFISNSLLPKSETATWATSVAIAHNPR